MKYRIMYKDDNGINSYEVVAINKTHAMLKLNKDREVLEIYSVLMV